MLAGASGGFRVEEVLAARSVAGACCWSRNRKCCELSADGLGPVPPVDALPNIDIKGNGPLADANRGIYDVVDLSPDFLDAAETNATAFTQEALVSYLRVLAPNGIVSIPVSIRDFPVYALRMLATVRAALLTAGIADPGAHVLVYRSAWSVRILVARDGWSATTIEAARKFCDDRSFDLSWYPGFDVAKARAGLYNDLPAVSFDKGEVESQRSRRCDCR